MRTTLTTKETISELLDNIRKVYVDRQKEQGIRSSGESADSLRIETTDTSGTLYGAKYFYQQKFGRKPGKFPPVDDILDWIRAKKITPKDPKTSERQLAFIFARKIARSGTDIHQGKREGLKVEDQVEELVKEFMKKLDEGFKAEIKASF